LAVHTGARPLHCARQARPGVVVRRGPIFPSKRPSSRVRRVPQVDDSPVGFAAARRASIDAVEWVAVPRQAAEKLVALGASLDLSRLRAIGLRGVSRFDSREVQRLEKDLVIALANSDDQSVKDAIATLMPLVVRISQDPGLALVVAGGT